MERSVANTRARLVALYMILAVVGCLAFTAPSLLANHLPKGSHVDAGDISTVWNLDYEEGFTLSMGADMPELAIAAHGLNSFDVHVDGKPVASFDSALSGQSIGVVAVEAQTDPYTLGITTDDTFKANVMYLGTYQKIASAMAFYDGLYIATLVLLLTLAVNAFVVYLYKPSERYLLSFAVYTLVSAIPVLMLAVPSIEMTAVRGIGYYIFVSGLRTLLIYMRIVICVRICGAVEPGSVQARVFSMPVALAVAALAVLLERYMGVPIPVLNAGLGVAGGFVLASLSTERDSRILLIGYALSTGALLCMTFLSLGLVQLPIYANALRRVKIDQVVFSLFATLYVNRKLTRKYDSAQALSVELDRLVAQKTVALEEESRNKHAVMTNIFHDLRSPLFQLQGCIDGALMKPEDTRENLLIMRERVAFLSRLTEELFLVARLEENKIELIEDEVDVEELLRDVVRGAAVQGSERGVEVAYRTSEPDGDERAGFVVWGDRTRLMQLFENLVDNALKHTADGTVVVVLLTHEGSMVKVAVSDQGPGIKPENLNRIFDRYYQEDGRDRQRSAGLGLSIVAELVRLHHASIDVSSEPGKGAVFTVAFKAME